MMDVEFVALLCKVLKMDVLLFLDIDYLFLRNNNCLSKLASFQLT